MVMYRVGLIGDPVAHSRSPLMHNAAFAHLGISATYELWHTRAADLATRIALLREPDVLGANVTLPHKAAVMPFLDHIEPEAANIGAVNTIYKQPDGSLAGANTDAPALLAALREEGQFHPAGQAVVLLGASGAARAAAYALIGAGVAQLVVANRTPERAEELLADLLANIAPKMAPDEATNQQDGQATHPTLHDDPLPCLIALALDDPELHSYVATSSLVINATSLGWNANETPLPAPPVQPGTLVYDMVYRPTHLLHESAARGARVLDGLGMLLRQGALAFTRWTGREAPLAVMHAALERGMQS